jgi:hypothetical protein
MAKISNVYLKITVGSNKLTPEVTYSLYFTEGDLNLLKLYPDLYSVRCELWGADSGFNGGDDKVYVYPITRHYPKANGGTLPLEMGKFEAVLNKGAELDEDWGGDEIYAKVILTNNFAGTKTAKNSNEVSGSF